MKRIHYILIALGIVLVILIVCLFLRNKNNNITSKKSLISEPVKFNKLEISSPSIVYEEGNTMYESKMVNNGKDLSLKYVKVYLYDTNGKEYTFNAYVGDMVKEGNTVNLSYSTDEKVENIKEVKYEIVK